MTHKGDRDALGSIHHLADARDSQNRNRETENQLWKDVNTSLRNVTTQEQMNYLTKTCEENGLLPRLFLNIAESGAGNPIDTNHDHVVTKEELEKARDTGDATTKFVADYALRHFNEMDKDHDGKLSANEMETYKVEHTKNTANPSDTAPYGEEGSVKDLQKQILDPHSTAQEKIYAIEQLHEKYPTEKYPDAKIMMKGPDGQEHEYKAQVTTLKNGSKLVHLYDDKGNIVLRGVDRGQGKIERENGQTYQGRRYSESHNTAPDALIVEEQYPSEPQS